MTSAAGVWITLPTYNERENIGALLERIFSLGVPGLRVLVVDDRSPDGTAEIVEGLKSRWPGLHLVVRSGEAGRGLAGKEGFLRALEGGAQAVVEMDADFSHRPEDIPRFLERLGEADVLVGSRFVPGGGEAGRSLWRRVLTVWANRYARGLLGLPVLDCNSGFRCFNRRALEAVNVATLRSRGPSIVHEVLYRASRAGLRIREVPILFVERGRGQSKLSLWRLLQGYVWILKLRFLS